MMPSLKGYTFYAPDNYELVAVQSLLDITVTFVGSPHRKADVTVCVPCWKEWIATPPWNDTPPTLKPPPICHHLDETADETESEGA